MAYGPATAYFRDKDTSQENVFACMITRTDTGEYCAYTTVGKGREHPDPEIVATLVQAVEIANL